MTHDPTNFVKAQELGRLIREKRKAEGRTLDEVAKLTGISASTLSRLERYNSDITKSFRPDMKTVTTLAQWLSVPVELLLSVREKEHQDTFESHLKAVEAHLRASRNLDAESMRLLSSILMLTMENATRQNEPV